MSRWHRVCNPCVPKTCGLVQEYCVEQFILSVVNLLRRTIYIMSVHVCELRLHTSSEVVARPTQELINLYRMRRRDMARVFDSGVGTSITGLGMGSLDADDWCFAVAAMPGERAGGRFEYLHFSSTVDAVRQMIEMMHIGAPSR